MEKEDQEKWKKERIFKILLYSGDRFKIFIRILDALCRFVFSVTFLMFLLMFIYYIGFVHDDVSNSKIAVAFRSILLILFISKFILGLISIERKIFSLFFRIAVLVITFLIILSNSGLVDSALRFWSGFYGNGMMVTGCFLIAILEVHRFFELISSVNFPPSLIFSSSFLVVILVGSGLLLLPNSRTVPISFIDALFTSVSAVCVTGLSVVNTAGSFTDMGKIVILGLIQIGGLGMMTFTGFFSFIFTSHTTLRERMLLQDMFSEESMGNLFKILVKIVLFTLLAELAGAFVIYLSLDRDMTGKGFFSIFHAVSAFCNAGFSTLPDGLMSPSTNRNYILLSAISILIIFGGLGFPVFLRLYVVAKNKVTIAFNNLCGRRAHTRRERLDAGSKIVLITTLLLLLVGTLVFYAAERKTSMSGLNGKEQLFLSFFNSVTARTAGFNMSNLNLIGYPAVFLLIFLMWIGASPGSTGGGIKTSSFAIACSSAWSIIRGRNRLDIFNREISHGTIKRVLAIIFLSLIVIGAGFFCLLLSDPSKNPVHLLFESVSAFSTVGLSLADTSTLSETGKGVIMLLMFIGRVGPLTFLTGLFISGKRKHYKYPAGDIAIN
jgi:trk system potassium uptake protein TrkH